jgi:hypothetical protein
MVCTILFAAQIRRDEGKVGISMVKDGGLDELAMLLGLTNGSSNIVSGATSGCRLSARTRGYRHTHTC